ncbi:MAG: M14 family zinc carboxypeptidase [Thermoguttaceae bacterium]|nr:M14 family zinc carboxypeptidase [Thermoguttaceae bacterium]MDW8038560.1 M14 family zinc carboxypeptidase [Thermoguttaceae bacterium]
MWIVLVITEALLAAETQGSASPVQPCNGQGLGKPGSCRLQCRSDFENGSGVVEQLDQKQGRIWLRPTEHKDRGWPCWWFVHVTGIPPGQIITLEVIGGHGEYARPERAAFSLDGKTWQQTSPGQRSQDRIVYQQKIEAGEAYFAWGPPFRLSDAERLLAEATKKFPWVQKFELCRSKEGRSVPALRIAEPGLPESERFGVWVIARQHAWESGSSWVAWGLIDWLASEEPAAAELRKKASLTIVPIMDVDNVCRGAGGKEQKPQDHNRDWSAEPYWPEVQAVQSAIRQWDSQGRMDLFLDLHNPGRGDRQPFFFVPPEQLLREPGRRNLARFLEAARTEITQPIPLAPSPRTAGPKYDARWDRISKNWVSRHCRPHVVALCLETPWDTPHSTIDGYMSVGRSLGRTIARYFQQNPRSP